MLKKSVQISNLFLMYFGKKKELLNPNDKLKIQFGRDK